MGRPIGLLTDFGYADAYVGVMKGVILSADPDARLFDLTHGIPAQNVLAGALHLAAAAPYCPPDTVFLAVVDPGVGSDRRPICIRSGRRIFVGPDNGLLWPAADLGDASEAFVLDRPKFWLPDPGATFHGRDIFAPIAAALALGTRPAVLGTRIDDPVRLEVPRPTVASGGVIGRVLFVDGFGNAITNIRPSDLGDTPPASVRFEGPGLRATPLASHYAAVPAGQPTVVLGSLGYYEVAINTGSAAAMLGLAAGSAIRVLL